MIFGQQLGQFFKKRVHVELVTGTRLMGTIHWVMDDGSAFGISDSGADDPEIDVVSTAHVVRIGKVR